MECFNLFHNLLNSNYPVTPIYQKRNIKNESDVNNEESLIEKISKIIGTSIEKLKDNNNLDDYGVDSLQLMAIKNIFDLYSIEKSVEELSNITIKEVKDLSDFNNYDKIQNDKKALELILSRYMLFYTKIKLELDL